MKSWVLLSLVLAVGCVRGAPVEQGAVEQGSCEDASAKGAAELALTKINQERTEGYIFGLHRLSNVHMAKHEETGVVFYLALDVVETNCSVLSKKDWKNCEVRPTHDTPVYGQCKAAIYINKVHRVVRLYKYNCVVRPVPAARVAEICPDCPTLIANDNKEVQKAVTLSLEKFNKESKLANRFAMLKVTRATSGMAMSMYYNAEYTIQETICAQNKDPAEKCPLMECEFAHKGFCKASLFYSPTGEPDISVECEIYEPEAAEREKKLHLLGGAADHIHTDHTANQTHSHDHVHDQTHKHVDGNHHHHAHDHSHDHGHSHDHVHAHHAKAHNHSGDSPNQHHDYKHADGVHTHEHDHELALDHDHKHAHLHEHEHHHHHHDHTPVKTAHIQPEGVVRMLPSLDQPAMTLPAFPDVPAGGPDVGVTLPLKPDPQIPNMKEPTIQAFPIAISAQCAAAAPGETLVEKLFAEDPMFKPSA